MVKKIQLPHGTTHLCVADVFRLMLENRDKSAAMDVFIDEQGEIQVRCTGGPFPFGAEMQSDFLKFCEKARITPRNPVTPWSGGYTGEGLQNGLYGVKVDEFRQFAEAYGFSVEIQDQKPVGIEPEHAANVEPDQVQHQGEAEQPARANATPVREEAPHCDAGMVTKSSAVGSAQKRKCDFVREVVAQVEGFCNQRGIVFDRKSMPGDAGDLLWLMERLHPDKFEGMELKAFRPHYHPVCSWTRAAGHQEGAKHLYLEAFPEAVTRLVGVTQNYM